MDNWIRNADRKVGIKCVDDRREDLGTWHRAQVVAENLLVAKLWDGESPIWIADPHTTLRKLDLYGKTADQLQRGVDWDYYTQPAPAAPAVVDESSARAEDVTEAIAEDEALSVDDDESAVDAINRHFEEWIDDDDHFYGWNDDDDWLDWEEWAEQFQYEPVPPQPINHVGKRDLYKHWRSQAIAHGYQPYIPCYELSEKIAVIQGDIYINTGLAALYQIPF